ncbi:GTP-binding protein [Tulasnella sp. JGI-2019a]|nr:GTP-binding protein [Tulasnella sp. JGI-2019a]
MTDYVESCLRGDALEWYIESDDVAMMDWRSLQKAFMGRFRAAPPATPTAVPTATVATDAKAKAAKRAKSEVEAAAETEPGASVTATKRATVAVAKKGAAAMDAAMATEAAATAEAATRAATAAAKRAATAAATATKAAEAAAEAVAEAKAAVTEMKAAVGTGAAKMQEAPIAPLPTTINADFGNLKATWFHKILIIGNSGVGKSSMLMRRLGHGWVSSTTPTVGIDYQVHTMLALGKEKNNLNKDCYWDASGADEYRSLLAQYYHGVTQIWIIYDITDQKSFQDVRRWHNFIKQYNPAVGRTRRIGNKCDLRNRRVVQTQQGRNLAAELGMTYFYELSARTNEGVQEMWYNMFPVISQI